MTFPYYRKFILLSLAVLLSSFTVCADEYIGQYYGAKEREKEEPQNRITISELNLNKPEYGTYHVRGFVVDQVRCTLCLDPDKCDPCTTDYIIISEHKKRHGVRLLTQSELMVIVENPRRFHVDQYYEFLVRVLDVKNLGRDQLMNNVEHIHSKKIGYSASDFQEWRYKNK